jgi:hypothetical protein
MMSPRVCHPAPSSSSAACTPLGSVAANRSRKTRMAAPPTSVSTSAKAASAPPCHAPRRHCGVHHHRERHVEQPDHRGQVALHVVGLVRQHGGVHRQGAGGADAERVAVRGGVGHSFGPDRADAAGPVLHDQAQRRRGAGENLGQQARQHVHGLSRREGHHQPHRARRIGRLGVGGHRRQREGDTGEQSAA